VQGKKFLAIMLMVGLQFILTGHLYAQTHFSPVADTGTYSAIVIENATINGAQIQAGDEIGVFDGSLCVGAVAFEGSFNVSVSAILEYTPPGQPTLPGAKSGNDMTFKLWQKSSNNEMDASATYTMGGKFGDALTVVSLLEGAYQQAPTATDVNITGTAKVGLELTGHYTYNDAEGDPEGTSTFRWLRDDAAIAGASAQTYTLVAADQGAMIKFEVTPAAQTGASPGAPVQSAAVGPVGGNTPPTATAVSLGPASPLTNDNLVGTFTYNDADGDPENGTEIRWYKDGALQAAYNDQLTVPSTATARGQQWYFTVRPNDGQEFGDMATSNTVTIGNTAPAASNLSISPEDPVNTDALTASYDYADVDGDAESNSEIRWYKNGVVQSTYNDQTTVPPSATAKGQQWYFTVHPKDGTDFGGLATSNSVTIGNTLPEATNLNISPAHPVPTDALTASYDYADGDGDTESGTEIQWYKDGALQAAYNDQLTVPSSATAKGQQWYFTVHPNDGENFGDVATSNTVTIGNTSPEASNLSISPAHPVGADALTANYDYADADGDTESGSEIRWYKDGALQAAYNDQLTLPSSATAKNQQWHFTVRPNDGEDFGDVETSNTVVIGNSAPEASNCSISPVNPVDTDALTANYDYLDVDGDTESGSEVRWYKNDALQATYNNSLTVPSSATIMDDRWYFTVRPKDGADFGVLQTSPTVTIGHINVPPTATNVTLSPSNPFTGDALVGSYTYTDAEGDPENNTEIRWYKNDALQSAYNDQLTVPASATSHGEKWHFSVHPKDGKTFGELATSAAVTIGNTAPVLNPISNQNLDEGQTANLNIAATDADGDGIALSLKNNPAFVTLTDNGNGAGVVHISPGFTDAGTFNDIKVIATDNFSTALADTETFNITVNDVPQHPVADAGGPYAALINTQVQFDGSGSSDADGSIISYEWNFGDGASGTGETISHKYNSVGHYQVILKVKDDAGMTDSDTTDAAITLILPKANFYATPTMGYPDLTVRFVDNSEGNPTAWLWDFGDGESSTEQNPTHLYRKSGKYDVTLTITTPAGENEVCLKDYIVVYGDEPLYSSPLELVDNSSASQKESWDNAIDGDISGWDGTVTAKGEPPFAIFKFKDGTTKQINKVRLLTDTGVEFSGRWATNFSVLVSSTGIGANDFTQVLQATKKGGNWQDFTFDPVTAKYIKLVIEQPAAGWRQIGEFEVCPIRQVADAMMSTATATSPHVGNGVDKSQVTISVIDTDGNPITDLSAEDFSLHATQSSAIYYPIIEETTPGMYSTQLACLGGASLELKVYVNGVLVGSPAVTFTQPEMQMASLELVEGSDTFEGEGWDNAIDKDLEGWDGTVTMTGSQAFAIFKFSDGLIKAVQKVNLLVDTGVNYANRWAKRFRIQVSTSGLKNTDFRTVYDGIQSKSGWQQHTFPAANARYIKLIVDYPSNGKKQLGELEIEVSEALILHKEGASSELASIIATPDEFSVSKNYPNPFNPTTKIEFSLPEPQHVTIDIFNMMGQRIRTLLDASVQEGYHTIIWNGTNDDAEHMPSGTYIVRVQTEKHAGFQKMMLIK